jgi:hypothetical protein
VHNLHWLKLEDGAAGQLLAAAARLEFLLHGGLQEDNGLNTRDLRYILENKKIPGE